MSRDPRWLVGRVYREEVKEKMAVAKKKPVVKKAVAKKPVTKKTGKK